MRLWMSAFLPAPLMIVVAVLVDLDLLGPAQLLELEVLELEAEVFADERAAGQDGDVAEHGLAAIAEAGRLDGADVSTPRSLLTTRAARASPSTSSAMISSGLPAWATFSSSGIISRRLAIFFSWIRIRRLRARTSSRPGG